MAASDIKSDVNSYLFEVFKLNPQYSEIYCKITNEESSEICMNDFMSRHYPKSPLLDNLENTLSPYFHAQELLAQTRIKYHEATKLTSEVEDIENLTTDEANALKRAKDDLPQLGIDLKKAEEIYKKEFEEMHEGLKSIIHEVNKLENSRYEKRREFVYEMLDKLEIPRSQFKDKTIDNPLKFKSYAEAYDYMERQTSIDRTKIPVKKWQDAANDYKIFEQLVVYLGLVDCLLPLGINYGK